MTQSHFPIITIMQMVKSNFLILVMELFIFEPKSNFAKRGGVANLMQLTRRIIREPLR